MPKLHMPKINLPKIRIPKLNLPKPKLPKVNLPKLKFTGLSKISKTAQTGLKSAKDKVLDITAKSKTAAKNLIDKIKSKIKQ